MILVIDTSGPRWAVALGERTLVEADGRPDLPALYRHVESPPDRVAVATGPGSFTGLRVGVAFGLGLAIGLKIPIMPLASLALRSARAEGPATAVIEAGRGRLYWQPPGGELAIGGPAEIPRSHQLVGDVTPKTEASLVAAGHSFVPRSELRDFAAAAAIVLETASEVPYRSLEIQYMTSFSAKG